MLRNMMSDQGFEEELNQILQFITQYPAGVSIRNIMKGIGLTIPRRTLQRRITTLLKQGRLNKKGRGRGTRYLIKEELPFEVELAKISSVQAVEDNIPLSPEAQSIKQYVTQPYIKRNPVSYQREFFESYIPNESCYLPIEVRQELAEIGKRPDGEQPAGTFARQIFHRLLIDLSWNSSRLEGNTYSLLETERLLAYGEAATGKSVFEAQMILNHKAASRHCARNFLPYKCRLVRKRLNPFFVPYFLP